MIVSLFILLEIIMIGVFFTAFFTKQEILWALSSVLSGLLMISSYNVQIGTYIFNTDINAYSYTFISHSFPFMMGVNTLFFGLTLILGLFDLFDKYGVQIGKSKGKV